MAGPDLVTLDDFQRKYVADLVVGLPGGSSAKLGALLSAGGGGITSAVVNGAGHLILTKSDNSTVDAGYVVGPQGAAETGGSANLPITSTYTASGAIAPSDRLAVMNSASECDMTLAAGSTDGQQLVVKRLGAGVVTVTGNIDGTAGKVLTADSGTLREAIRLIWSSTFATWLVGV